MRVVLDSNILARAARGGHALAAEIVRQLLIAPHVLIVSPFLLSELSRALRYTRLRTVHGLSDAGIDTSVRRLQTGTLLVNPTAVPRVVLKDPTDDHVIAAAMSGKASIVGTNDHHFDAAVHSYCAVRGIRILTDLELLRELRQSVS